MAADVLKISPTLGHDCSSISCHSYDSLSNKKCIKNEGVEVEILDDSVFLLLDCELCFCVFFCSARHDCFHCTTFNIIFLFFSANNSLLGGGGGKRMELLITS